MFTKVSLSLLAVSMVVAGSMVATPVRAVENPTVVPFIRMYNPTINDHFYTNSESEAATAQTKYGYRHEGVMGYIYAGWQPNGDAVMRLWNPSAGKHFYTANVQEADAAVRGGFVREGLVGYMISNSPIKVYRLYHPRIHKHFFTTAWPEVEQLKRAGYIHEGELGKGLVDATQSSGGYLIESGTSYTAAVGQYFSVFVPVRYSGPSGVYTTATFRNLPAGLSGSGESGGYHNSGDLPSYLIYGTPTATCNNCAAYLDITDSMGRGATFSLYFTITSQSSPLNITTFNLPSAIVGQPYTAQLQATGGVAPYTWSYTNTTYPSACCVLGFGNDGKFTTQTSSTIVGPAGLYSWTVQVTDSVGNTDTENVYMLISPDASATDFELLSSSELPLAYLYQNNVSTIQVRTNNTKMFRATIGGNPWNAQFTNGTYSIDNILGSTTGVWLGIQSMPYVSGVGSIPLTLEDYNGNSETFHLTYRAGTQ